MPTFLCQLKNNADFAVRVVTISQFGQSDRIIPALQTIVTQFQDGRKVLIAWRADSGELLENHVIRVNGSSLFKVFKEAAEMKVNSDGTTTTVFIPVVQREDGDLGETINNLEDLGAPLG